MKLPTGQTGKRICDLSLAPRSHVRRKPFAMVDTEYQKKAAIAWTSTNAVWDLGAADYGGKDRYVWSTSPMCRNLLEFVGIQVSLRTLVVSAQAWVFGSTNLRYERVNSEEKTEQG